MKKITLIIAALLMTAPVLVHATVVTGDHFNFDWTETVGLQIGLTGTAAITIGSPGAPGYFHIDSFRIFQNGGFCGVCTPVTENLTGVMFHGTTLGIVGDVTGSFLGRHGGTHTFDLTVGDDFMWKFVNTHPSGLEEISYGTYSTVRSSVPEPATLALMGLGLAGIGLARRQRKNA